MAPGRFSSASRIGCYRQLLCKRDCVHLYSRRTRPLMSATCVAVYPRSRLKYHVPGPDGYRGNDGQRAKTGGFRAALRRTADGAIGVAVAQIPGLERATTEGPGAAARRESHSHPEGQEVARAKRIGGATRPSNRLHRRVWSVRETLSRTHLGPTGLDTGPAVQLQLEAAVGHCRGLLLTLLLPPLPRHDPHAAGY